MLKRRQFIWREPPPGPRHRTTLRRTGFCALAITIAIALGAAFHWPRVSVPAPVTTSPAALSSWPLAWVPDVVLAWQWRRLPEAAGTGTGAAAPDEWPEKFGSAVLARLGPAAGRDHFSGRVLPRDELRLVPVIPFRLVTAGGEEWTDPANAWLWLPVSAAAAGSRRGRGLEHWQPAGIVTGCPYVRRWMRARIRWNMEITAGERERGIALLEQCEGH